MKQFIAKYKIKGQDKWYCFPFWAKDKEEARKIWESDYKHDWCSIDYEFEELNSNEKTPNKSYLIAANK